MNNLLFSVVVVKSLYVSVLEPERESMADKKQMNKAAVLQELAVAAGLTRRQVAAVLDALSNKVLKRELSKKGPGVFVLPGLLKLRLVHKPATPAHKGINPFTKQEQVFKAKPARSVVKAQPLKSLKDMVM
jgi:nucleoid DNA-binding protein